MSTVTRCASIFAFVSLLLTRPASADVITGVVSDWVEASAPREFGDGANHITIWWSINVYGAAGWFYGSDYGFDTDVALADSIADITEISDAGAFSFQTFYVGPARDAENDGGVGDFLVFRNINTGHYGVLRLDNIDNDKLNGTWWFQTDGSGDFSAQPPCGPCDTNCDGSVNQFDIQSFIDVLGGSSAGCSPCAADANGDGSVNQFDIQGFVECLGG